MLVPIKIKLKNSTQEVELQDAGMKDLVHALRDLRKSAVEEVNNISRPLYELHLIEAIKHKQQEISHNLEYRRLNYRFKLFQQRNLYLKASLNVLAKAYLKEYRNKNNLNL